MRHGTLVLTLGLLAAAARVTECQAARVGRLPVLEVPSQQIGVCREDTVTTALREEGIARLITFHSSDSSGYRLVSLGMGGKGATVMLLARMGTKEGARGESESVDVFFNRDGTVLRGTRSAITSGMPARLSEDRHLGLLPADTAAARRLVAALRKRCRA